MVFRRSKEAKFRIQPDDPVDPSTAFTVSRLAVLSERCSSVPCAGQPRGLHWSLHRRGLPQQWKGRGQGWSGGVVGGCAPSQLQQACHRGQVSTKSEWFPTPHYCIPEHFWFFRQTNNVAEIQAGIVAIRQAVAARRTKLLIHTDSQFLISCVTQWMQGWKVSTEGR